MTTDREVDEEADLRCPPEQLDVVIDRLLDKGVIIENEARVCVLDIEVAGVSSQAFVRGLDWAPDDARPARSAWLQRELRKIRERESSRAAGE